MRAPPGQANPDDEFVFAVIGERPLHTETLSQLRGRDIEEANNDCQRKKGETLSVLNRWGSYMDRRDCIRLAAAAIAARLLPVSAAFAQSKYPQSTIRLIVPYAPGGVVD